MGLLQKETIENINRLRLLYGMVLITTTISSVRTITDDEIDVCVTRSGALFLCLTYPAFLLRIRKHG